MAKKTDDPVEIPVEVPSFLLCPDNDVKGATVYRRRIPGGKQFHYPKHGTQYSWSKAFLRTAEGKVYIMERRHGNLPLTRMTRTDRKAYAAALGVPAAQVDALYTLECNRENAEHATAELRELERDAKRLGFKVVPL